MWYALLYEFISQTHRKREYICVPHYRESPGRWAVKSCFSRLRGGVYGTDGRWLWSGRTEHWTLLRTAISSDGTACYSGDVFQIERHAEVCIVGYRWIEVVTRDITRLQVRRRVFLIYRDNESQIRRKYYLCGKEKKSTVYL